jgi:hypothetical protein
MIFISYSDENRQQAESLMNYLDENIEMIMEHIACPGESWQDAGTYPSLDCQKAFWNKVKAVIAIVSPDSAGHGEILFRLGAAWALDLFILIIFLPGIDIRDMPEPLSNSPFVDVDSKDAHIRLRDATRDIASLLGLREKKGANIFLSLDRTLKAMRMRNAQSVPGPDLTRDDDAQDNLDEDFTPNNGFVPSTAEFYDIVYTVNGKTSTEEINIRASWDSIFKAVASNLREPRDEAFIKKLILELCKEKNPDLRRGIEYKLFLNPLLNVDCYSQIMNQFLSRNFIKTTRPPHSIFKKRDNSKYWIITNEGEENLRSSVQKLRSLRR